MSDCLKAKEIMIEAEVDKEVIKANLDVDQKLCADKPKLASKEEIMQSTK